ncbi:acetyl-CoA carboxylase [Reticulomyxa filosa]|uniref:Acetyl-CoA carboxylase n=1 Tax=Reticulomyxa filosa TaxID=46433 RepID=X6NDB8_RETFI|nr:acetyl-CoA carboxylase [Reticulomyxa filosa]|eukprot:ETO23976.1 acetyl-CoA carboxylase [Reticulomyxa filosa]
MKKKANAEYIRMADFVQEVPGGSNNYNYANVPLIVNTAKQTKCDAVWPGWGHASENPALPRELNKAKIMWVGPTPAAMYAGGDKIMSTLIGQTAGVQCIPWSGDGILVKYNPRDPDSREMLAAFKKSCVNSVSEVLQHAKRIGFPLMIKASEGGGGKGIRKCEKEGDVESCYNQVINEVPGSPVFVMKLATNARHLEVQILGDKWGNVISLYGRDCSIQRRHQKIIEEGPVVNVDPSLLLEMESAAVRLGKAIHYVGAGTVEFLYDNDTKNYFLLELNPRLQVEHPVTEMATDVNLPALMVMVAMGIPLYAMKDVRRLYGCSDLDGVNKFKMDPIYRVKPLRHCIACRITAENPLNNFRPTSGQITELHFRSAPRVWGYFSLKTKGRIHEYADSQFGHIFASGATREEARKQMVLALGELDIRGEIRTTVELLQSIMQHKEYIKGTIDTQWLERVINVVDVHALCPMPSHLTPQKIVLLGCISSAHKKLTEKRNQVLTNLKHGRSIIREEIEDKLVFAGVVLIYQNVKYDVLVEKTSPQTYTLRHKKWFANGKLSELSDGGYLISMDLRTHTVYADWNSAGQLVITIDHHTVVFEQEYDPSNIRAEMPGKLVRVLVPNNTHVEKGDAFAEIEVMKMYMPLLVPESGTIQITATVGSILQIGQSIATLKLDDPSRVKTARNFESDFDEISEAEAVASRMDVRLKCAHQRVEHMLDGYIAGTDIAGGYDFVKMRVGSLIDSLRDPRLAVDEICSALEPLKPKLPEQLYKKLEEIATSFKKNVQPNRFQWEAPQDTPSHAILKELEAYKESLKSARDRSNFDTLTTALRESAEKHTLGAHHLVVRLIVQLLEKFLICERQFVEMNETIVIQNLRQKYPDNLERVCDIIQAHFQLRHREKVVLELLNIVDNIFTSKLFDLIGTISPILEEMTTLVGMNYSRIHLKAREILLSLQVPNEKQRRMEIEDMLRAPKHGTRVNIPGNTSEDGGGSTVGTNKEKANFMQNASRMPQSTLDSRELLRQLPDILEILPASSVAKTFTQCKFNYSSGDRNPGDESENTGTSHQPKHGLFGFFNSLATMEEKLPQILHRFPTDNELPCNVIILGFKCIGSFSESSFIDRMENTLQTHHAKLKSCGIGFLSVLVHTPGSVPPLFTFRHTLNFKEDPITRHILPPLVEMLEMDRLKEFDIKWIPTENRRLHLFEGIPKRDDKKTSGKDNTVYGRRLFMRVPVAQLVKPRTLIEDVWTDYYRFDGPEFAIMEAVHALESIMGSDRQKWNFNHILLSCFFDADFSVVKHSGKLDLSNKEQRHWWIKKLFRYVHNRMHRDHELFDHVLRSLHVTHLEVRVQVLTLKSEYDQPFAFRVFCDDPGNGIVHIHSYFEKKGKDGRVVLVDISGNEVKDPLHGTEPRKPHPVTYPLMQKRQTARSLDTTYIYDWPTLLERSVLCLWDEHSTKQTEKTRAALAATMETLNLMDSHKDSKEEHFVRDDTLSSQASEELFQDKHRRDHSKQSAPPLSQRTSEDPKVVGNVSDEDLSELKDVDTHIKENEEKEQLSQLLFHPSIENAHVSFLKRQSCGVGKLMEVTELILDKSGKLVPTERSPGQNTVVECPEGREIYLVGNDITFNLGTVGCAEDDVYNEVCKCAIAEGIPFVHISASSGARIGMDDKIRNKFKVHWSAGLDGTQTDGTESGSTSSQTSVDTTEDEEKKENANHAHDSEITIAPEGQYVPEYLYLEEEDYEQLKHLINAEKLVVDGKIRWRLLDIIGTKGIGVENLSGSGLIAGSTSRAYASTFTLSYVTGRSVGIGAYLVRLGQRVIQRSDSPILLTGFVALNNLLGRSLYVSNLQIGGADEVMMPNGVSHRQVNTDMRGAYEILKWLSFVRPKRGMSYPITDLLSVPDPVEREVKYFPRSDKEDPRHLIAGQYRQTEVVNETLGALGSPSAFPQESGTWLSGMFDENSWVEYLPSWAKTVVVGRACLGSLPVGIIASEPRTQQAVIPPDPANLDSSEIRFQQAGQVWYPDSSFKTAQAIQDFNGEELPLFILANWRGFSGGQRDMFNEILKYGSFIVDHLTNYTQPIFIYLPPMSELRGGAWVVLDSLINPNYIEMYATESARANVLEPTGTIGLKYRKELLLATAHRLDSTLMLSQFEKNCCYEQTKQKLVNAQLRKLKESNSPDKAHLVSLEREIENRERSLLPVYKRVSFCFFVALQFLFIHIKLKINNKFLLKIALMFAELHDTPGRMKSVNVIREVVSWNQSRRFFYWRLRHKMIDTEAIKVRVICLVKQRDKLFVIFKMIEIIAIMNVTGLPINIAAQRYEEWCAGNVMQPTAKKTTNEQVDSDVTTPDKQFVRKWSEKEEDFKQYVKQLESKVPAKTARKEKDLMKTLERMERELKEKDLEIATLKNALAQAEAKKNSSDV